MTNAPVFITGDRMMAFPYPTQVACEIMRAFHAGRPVATGTNPEGVEAITRAWCEQAGVPVQVIEHSLVPGTDWGDWDKRHASLPEGTEIVAVHVDPMSDTLTKMLLASHPDTRLVTPADLLQVTLGEDGDIA